MRVDLIQMIDIFDPAVAEIQISTDGTIWVNVDGVCRLRVRKADRIEVTDDRKDHSK